MQCGKKLCAFLMVLCLVVGFIPAGVFASESKTEVVGQQLFLGDDLTMHFYVSISDAHKADGIMNVEAGGSSKDYSIQNMTADGDGNYVFSVELGAPQMTEDITLTLTSGGEKVLEKVYSIQDYAHYLLENNYSSETKNLVKEMLNYGAKAQLYFDHNTTDLANDGYVIEAAGVIDTTSPEVVVSGAVDGIRFYGCSMVFESKIAIRYYFTASNGVEGCTFTVDGTQAEPVYKNDMYYIEIHSIAPDAMDVLRTVKVAKDDAELSVQYSPVYYITRMYNKASTGQALKELLAAAKGYFDAAKVFTGVAKNTLTIGAARSDISKAKTLYFTTNLTHGLDLYTDLTSVSNEETHILINGQAWNGQELRTFEKNVFYVNNIATAEGTQLTIREGFSITLHGESYVTEQEYNFWWINGTWVTAKDTLKITALGSGNAGILYFHINTATGVADWTNIASKCNEETHILINDQAWSTQEIGGISGKEFYVNKIDATEGTKLTVKAGFTAIFSGVAYVTAQDYTYWWNGTAWTDVEPIPEKPLTIGAVQSYSNAKTLYFATDYTHGMSLYASATGYANEETHILVNGQAWGGYELCAFEGNVFYINNIGATEGATVTIKEGFTIQRNGVKYITAQDYNFWWINGTWVTAKETLKITTLGSGNATILYFRTETETGVADWTNIASKCNEETHILINDQAWSTQEIGGISGKEFYVNKIGATVGTKLTVKAGFTAVFKGVAYTTDQDYTYWWNGTAWTANQDTLTITGLGAGNASILYFRINTTTGVADWANIAGKCNEETHILINDQAWSTQELGGINGQEFYVNKISAAVGTKLTIKKGFAAAFNGALYVTDQDYNYWWTGSAWTANHETLSITGLGAGNASILYFKINTTTGVADWADIAGKCNEETHILINGQAWSTQALGGINGKEFYANNLNAAAGTNLTIQKGFAAVFNGTVYVTERDYSLTFNGSSWTIDLPLAEKVLTIGEAQSYSNTKTLYFATDYTHGMSLYASATGYANEETHILVNGEAWNGYELCAFEGNVFYINNIGATEGTTVTIKKGFTIYRGGIVYTTEQDYTYKWNGSAWVDVSFVAPEGIWNEMPLGVFGSPYNSQQAYDECTDAGFNFALIDQNYAAIGTTSYKAILNYCVQAGMNPISMTFGENDTTDYSDVPGYAGKFYFDEPGASEFTTIAAMVDDFEAQGYNNGIFLNNLLPSYASKLTLGSWTYETYLNNYVTQVLSKVSGPKWLSVDFYPLRENASGSTDVHENYLYNLEATAQTALAHKDMDLTVHYFVQTHGYGDGEWNARNLSSVADIRYQYNCAMAYGVNAFSVFAYPTQKGDIFENGNGLVTINADGTTTKNAAYYYVQQANNELKAWDEIYLSYDYEGTMAIAKSTSGETLASKLKNNLTGLTGTSVLSASNDTLIGQFDKNGSKAYMVANYSDPANGAMDTVIMNFADGTALQVIINGVTEDVTVSGGRLVLSLDAGEAAFVIVK